MMKGGFIRHVREVFGSKREAGDRETWEKALLGLVKSNRKDFGIPFDGGKDRSQSINDGRVYGCVGSIGGLLKLLIQVSHNQITR